MVVLLSVVVALHTALPPFTTLPLRRRLHRLTKPITMATTLRKPPRHLNLSLQDRSMHAHDTNAIPSLTLRRPRTPVPTKHTITHLVKAQEVHLAVEHLRTITLTDPTTLPYIVHAIRKHLLPRPARRPRNPTHPLTLIHQLVRTVPYFYRYIAFPAFFRGLWRLQSDPASSLSVRLLIAAWARDLTYMYHHRDPAAAFWVLTYQRLARHVEFPVPPPYLFVHRVTPMVSKKVHNPPQQLAREDVAATLRLMDSLSNAVEEPPEEPPEASCLRHQSATLRALPMDLSSIPESESQDDLPDFDSSLDTEPAREQNDYAPRFELNEKLLAVLRRHDELCGRSDPYYLAPPTRISEWDSNGTLPFSYSMFSRSSSSTPRSVAALARENARRKLSESKMSVTMNYKGGSNAEAESFLEELTVGGFEPSTFADVEVEGEGCYDYPGDQDEGSRSPLPDYSAAIESVGDTVILPAGFGFNQGFGGQVPVEYGHDSIESR